MSGDEFGVFLVGLAGGLVGWSMWAIRLASVTRLGGRRPHVWVLAAVVAACAGLIGVVLRMLASPDVRNDPMYLAMYFLLGLAWLRGAEFFFAYAGVSVRDDAVERLNLSALMVASGALLGVASCYAGANVGSGPGWWVVVFCAFLATLTLGAVWLGLDFATGIHDRVTIDRDAMAGVRLGALLAALGAMFGRAVAGDWHSVSATVVDFARLASPAFGLAAVAIAVELVFRRTAGGIKWATPLAAAPAAGYLLASAWYLRTLGLPA